MSGLSLTVSDWSFIGSVLQGFFYGFYSAIFAIYLHYQASNKCADQRPTLIFVAICILYILSAVLFALDTARFPLELLPTGPIELDGVLASSNIISSCCDLIAQSILIYRCWIVWNHNIRVVIVPSILAFTFFVLWLASVGLEIYASLKNIVYPEWGLQVGLASVAISLIVNALVTGLLVFKIFEVYWKAKPLYDQPYSVTGGSRLRAIILIIIESGMTLFAIQLAWLVLNIVSTPPATSAYEPIVRVQRIFNGIIPTIIQVRVSMGLSSHDKESIASLRFVTFTSNSEMEDDVYQANGDVSISLQNFDHKPGESTDNIALRRQSKDFDIVEVQREEDVSI